MQRPEGWPAAGTRAHKKKKKVLLYREKNELTYIKTAIDFLHLIRDVEEMGFTEADKYDGNKEKFLDKDKLLFKLLFCLFSWKEDK